MGIQASRDNQVTIQVRVVLAVTVVCQGSLASQGFRDLAARGRQVLAASQASVGQGFPVLAETQGLVGSLGRVGFLDLQASPVIRVMRPVFRAFQGGAETIQVAVVIQVTAEFQALVV